MSSEMFEPVHGCEVPQPTTDTERGCGNGIQLDLLAAARKSRAVVRPL